MTDQAMIRSFGILYRTCVNFISKSLSSMELSFSDSIFLVNIGESEGITQEKISTLLAIDKAAIARSVKRLEKKGFVTAERSLQDRRSKELYLTAAGREMYHYLLDLQDKWLHQVLADVNAEEMEIFTRTIIAISDKARSINTSKTGI